MHKTRVDGAGYYCGHNPMLVARKVQRLRVISDHELEWKRPQWSTVPMPVVQYGELRTIPRQSVAQL